MAEAVGWAGNPPGLSTWLTLLSIFAAGSGELGQLQALLKMSSYCQGALQWCWEGTGRGAGYFAAQAWEGMRG